jgi:transglutaminase-like putative cysteine protease
LLEKPALMAPTPLAARELQVYLPGAGWVEFDPTNGFMGATNLIRVAVTRDPAQALPVSGSFIGPNGAYLDMRVEVRINAYPVDEN